MRIIDTHSGDEVRMGGVYDGHQVLAVQDRFFVASALVRHVASGHRSWVPLTVRFMHPSFLFQRVLFLPS